MEKYDLKEMQEEIKRDQQVEKPVPKLLTQEEIQAMIITRNKKGKEKSDAK